MKRIIYAAPSFLAVAEDGVLTEYIPSTADHQSGDILLGTVRRLMPGISAAFVDIGREKCGFLPMRESSLSFSSDSLRSGDCIAVQIRKEEIRPAAFSSDDAKTYSADSPQKAAKGAFLTRDLSIPGKFILLMPLNRYIGVSSSIRDEEERERLRSLGRKLADGRFGLILRAAAKNADPSKIACELDVLSESWECLKSRIREGGKPGTVLFHADPLSALLADYEGRGSAELHDADSLPETLMRQLRDSLNRVIRLPSGGSIVFDPCEALTVVDVNSGSAAGNGAPASAYLQTNLEACPLLAAQIRLRNLSGIILVDFIDMERPEDREAVAASLRQYLDRDRRKTVIHGWTSLGLLEMTRKRTD